jgi:transketolase
MSSTKPSCRHAFSAALLRAVERDERIYVVTSDSRGSVTVQNVATRFPSRFVEVGIAEQNAVSISAGLAKAGKRVFVCGPASFYSSRCVDQVKVDIAYAHSDVKIIGVSGGVSYGALGGTHHSLNDIAVMRTFPGMQVFLPCDAYQTDALTTLLAASEGPAYLRIGRGAVPEVYPAGCGTSFRIGTAPILHEGTDCTIAAAGETVYHALGAARFLEAEGIGVRVLDCWSIKPLDIATVVQAAWETDLVLSVEEHSVYGGLGAAIAETLIQRYPVPMRILGFPDEWLPAGSSPELFRHFGLTAEKLAGSVRDALKMRGRVKQSQ